MSGIVIPVSVGLRGDVKMFMRNVVTGEVETREMRNTLLNTYLNNIFNSTFIVNLGLLSSVGNNVRIGTSGQPASRSDTGIIGTQLASKAGTAVYSGTNPRVGTITAVFPAGTGTGTVQEVVLAGNVATARQVVSPALNKTAQHELTVEWTITLSRGADSWSGTIAGGQRDGSTDINWVATICDAQMGNWANQSTLPAWASCTTIVGTSNAASDLVNDFAYAIKGTQLFSGLPAYREPQAYVLGSYYRDVRVGFETTQCNGTIGELIFNNLFRITFSPTLDKVYTYRLYLTLRLAVVNAT